MSVPPLPESGADAMGRDVLVAIDVGTSGARASAFAVSGAPLGEVRRPYPTSLPEEGWAEQDARRWQIASVSALAGLARELGPGCRIHGIGITGQCPSVVPVDSRSLPLRPGIIYRDNRATAEAAWLSERFGARRLHALTGHVPAAFHVAAKILWIRTHEPSVFAATRRFMQPTDYVVLALTGETATDWTMGAATALLGLRERRWAADLLADLDLDPGLLPPLHPSWSVIGGLRPSLARRLALSPDIPVVSGAGDSIACAIGAGVTTAGPVSEMAGSSTCLNSVVAEPLADLDVTHYPSAVDQRGYVTEVGINTTGEALDWVAQLAYSGPGRRPRPDDYARIDRDAALSAAVGQLGEGAFPAHPDLAPSRPPRLGSGCPGGGCLRDTGTPRDAGARIGAAHGAARVGRRRRPRYLEPDQGGRSRGAGHPGRGRCHRRRRGHAGRARHRRLPERRRGDLGRLPARPSGGTECAEP